MPRRRETCKRWPRKGGPAGHRNYEDVSRCSLSSDTFAHNCPSVLAN